MTFGGVNGHDSRIFIWCETDFILSMNGFRDMFCARRVGETSQARKISSRRSQSTMGPHESGEQTRNTPDASLWVKRILRLSRVVIYGTCLKPTMSAAVVGFWRAWGRTDCMSLVCIFRALARENWVSLSAQSSGDLDQVSSRITRSLDSVIRLPSISR